MDDTNLELNEFANDHSVQRSFKAKSREDVYAIIEKFLLKMKEWIDTVRLNMNEAKTEFMLLRSTQHLKKCTTDSLEHQEI